MLSWFVEHSIAKQALTGTLIEEEDIECRPERVTNAVIDENVDIYIVRRFFTHDAWKLIEDLQLSKRNINQWPCKSCEHDVHSERSIVVTRALSVFTSPVLA